MANIIIVTVKYTIADGKRGDFLRAVNEAGIIAASKAEDGNLLYEYSLPLDSENVVCLLEMWKNKESQTLHAASEHFKRLTEIKKNYVVSAEIKSFTAAE